MSARRLAAAGLLVVGLARPAASQDLGTVHFPVSCTSRAQARFDRAMALLHHMTYPRARIEFEQVARIDPRCAMARWGWAMTLFQPLWPTRPSREDLQRGRDSLAEARRLGPATERERLFLDAAWAFFEPDSAEYAERLRRWHAGMRRVHAAFPRDAEASVWFALAQLAVAPAGSAARASADRAARLLHDVYRRYPDHPGAMHYLIHADDAPGREHDSPDVVRRYAGVAPRNPHALHMPTHIYTRLGEWPEVIEGNLRAARAALEQRAGPHGEFVWDEFPHAVEYLVYAYLQQGDTLAALEQLRRLQTAGSLEPTFKTAFHLSSTAARYALERHAWGEARALVPRTPATLEWEHYPWAEAVTWFAKGIGAAHAGQVAEAGAAARRLAELEGMASRSGEQLFSRQIAVLRLAVEGWREEASGRRDSAVALLRSAAELERATPKPAVTPAPTIPAEELLGDLLLEQRRASEARQAYRRSLALYPGRRNSLIGADRAGRVADQR